MDNEKSNESIVSFAFVLASALAAYLTSTLFEIFGATFGAVARIRNIQAVQHGLPIVIGLGLFLYLLFNKRAHTWADEAVTEVRKVVWPSKKDVTAMTMVVCVMVVLAGVGLGIFDFFASQLIKVFVN